MKYVVHKLKETDHSEAYCRRFNTLDEVNGYFSEVNINAPTGFTPGCMFKSNCIVISIFWYYVHDDELNDSIKDSETTISEIKNDDNYTLSEMLQGLYDSVDELWTCVYEETWSGECFEDILNLIKNLAKRLGTSIEVDEEKEE